MSHSHAVRNDGVGITGVGSSLPDHVVTSAELQAELERASALVMPPDVLRRVTGIDTRRVSHAGEYASTLAVQAAHKALEQSRLNADEIDLLIFASGTRDVVEPATAHIVQAELGMHAHAFDLTNACNSFLNGIDTARAFILAGRAANALVVTGETPTRAMPMQVGSMAQLRDSFASYTFGDAGAAVTLERVPRGGIQHVSAHSYSEHWEIGGIDGGGSRHPRGDEHTYFHGSGHRLRSVFEHITLGALDKVRRDTGLTWFDYEHVLVHQVTYPYLERFIEGTGVPKEKIVPTVAELGNMASATLGVQLGRVESELRTGDKVLFVGLGGGVSIMTIVWEKS